MATDKMRESCAPEGCWGQFEEKLKREGIDRLAIAAFCHYYAELLEGGSGFITGREIEPVSELPQLATLEQFADGDLQAAGQDVLDNTCVVKLNGGLGTSMGLDRAKSLLPVRDGMTFLDIIIRQVIALREEHRCSIPLLLMNSFRSEADSESVVAKYGREFKKDQDGFPSSFLQNKVPKVLRQSLQPAENPENPELEWCPPGHGDIYLALAQTGLMNALREKGYRYLFVSNSDNLGATLDLRILGYMTLSGTEFLMEVAQRTEADSKGGHLARTKAGSLTLREIAQCPESELAAFQDIELYRYFNTNTLWIDLDALAALLEKQGGFLHLPLIKNTKRLDPQDPQSPEVYQLETAMGAAISLFERSGAVVVPRSRFLPVKKTNDLLLLNSDLFELKPGARLERRGDAGAPLPLVELDAKYYSTIADFQQRFSEGIPSLRDCRKLSISGDVRFAEGVRLQGDVRICNDSAEQRTVAPGTIVNGELILD